MATIALPQLKDVEAAMRAVFVDYANRIYSEAMAGIKAPGIRSTFRLEVSQSELRAEIWSDSEIAAYIEFGTGPYASAYLSGKEPELVDEAMKFYVNGKGTLPANPYLFPTYYKYRDAMIRDMDDAVQKYFDSL